MTSLLPCVTLEPTVPARSAVIWLHGLGADGHDFANMVPQLGLPIDSSIRFIFPHAPIRPVTISGGYAMRAWYDILGLGRLSQQDVSGIQEADESVCALIHQQEQAGLSTDRIVLAGFSQGGAMALYTGVRYPRRLAGILALSTYLPLAETLPQSVDSCPILMIHGTEDSIVSFDLGEHSRAYLEKQHYNVEWLTYPMGHSVCPEEIEHIRSWLQRIGL